VVAPRRFASISEQALFFLQAVRVIPSRASCVTVLPSEKVNRDSQATNSWCMALSAAIDTRGAPTLMAVQ
jgi:hypothetical protein